jgi:hypothetical protein
MVKPSLYFVLWFVISFDSVRASAQTLSPRPLTAEQVAIYRVVLQEYKDDSPLHLANRTDPFELEIFEANKSRLQSEGILLNMAKRSVFHDLSRDVELDPRVVLIDPGKREIVKKNDPTDLLRNLFNGQPPVDRCDLDKLEARYAFATEMITFSEIAFNKQHTRAALWESISYSRLEGESCMMVLKKVRGKWKMSTTGCPQPIMTTICPQPIL